MHETEIALCGYFTGHFAQPCGSQEAEATSMITLGVLLRQTG